MSDSTRTHGVRAPVVVLEGRGPTVVDRMVGWLNPVAGLRRAKARAALAMAESQIAYTGARRDRPATRHWTPAGGSADADILPSLSDLRNRSRDMTRNFPLATAAFNAATTETIGPGFHVNAAVARDILGLTLEQAQAWERRAEWIFRTVASGRNLDFSRRQTFPAMQYTALWSAMESGDVLVVRRYRRRPGDLLGVKFQLVEADRVSNPHWRLDTDRLIAGVEIDGDGATVAHHVASRHPGDFYSIHTEGLRWSRVPAFGPRSGERLSWLLYQQTRPNQTRGVPYLAPVVEALKQLSDYGSAELRAAVVNSLFTVIVKSAMPESNPLGFATEEEAYVGDEGGSDESKVQYRLGSGLVIEGDHDDSFEFVDPKRPNQSFDAFVTAWIRQIGAALGIPFEVLVRHFNSSFSASQAAMLEAWRFFQRWQRWMVEEFCQPIYELVLAEAVSVGLLDAPGFFEDPLARAAWCGTKWIGPRRGMIRPDIEMKAAKIALEEWLSTGEDESARLFGADWEHVYEQRTRELRVRAGVDAGLQPAGATGEEATDQEAAA